MTFSLYTPPFTNDVSLVPADFLEQLRVDLNLAIDGNAGGAHSVAFTWSGTHTHTGQIELSGSTAGFLHRIAGTIGDAGATLYVTYDLYQFTATPTADRVYTLNHTAAPIPQLGQIIKVVHNIHNNTNAAVFKREDATELARITGNSNRGFVEFIYTTGGWVACGAGDDGTITAH